LFKIEARPETSQEFVWVYHAPHEGPFSLAPLEIETGAWFDPNQVTQWIERKPEDFASAFRVLWGRRQEILPGRSR
jgi:hypothetical protein